MDTKFMDRIGYSVAEFLERFPLGKTSFYAAVARGEIRTIKIGGRTFVPAAEVERLARGDILPAVSGSDKYPHAG
jgi:Helix-turn-helix domain